jgi:hypothetical protein
MLKSWLNPHCMQCDEGCQGSCGELRRGFSTTPQGDLSSAFAAPSERLWLGAVATGCRALKRSLGLFEAVVGICICGLWEQDQTHAYNALPAWSKNSQAPLHQPAEPEPLPDGQPGCNRL